MSLIHVFLTSRTQAVHHQHYARGENEQRKEGVIAELRETCVGAGCLSASCIPDLSGILPHILGRPLGAASSHVSYQQY